MKSFLIFGGLLIGYCLIKDREKISQFIATLTFKLILPVVVLIEFSSVEITKLPLSFAGFIFVVGLFYLGKILGFSKHQAALLATAEGGTIGFALFVYLGVGPITDFLMIDMLGNGICLFSFVYYQVSRKSHLKDFIFNPLLVAMFMGLILNLLDIKLLSFSVISSVELCLVLTTTFFICVVVGSGIVLSKSYTLFSSSFFIKFWFIRIIGMIVSIISDLPLPITILFILPPSFLLPLMYDFKSLKHKDYASNFIAACLPVCLFLSLLLLAIY
ncbi:hypothetical protein C0584_05925 [Candidatus Parcubacteria bacterium]|nr:MAG: hypothetical protein C0584_05925 [Candidatus Parcubacteria bacterium]